MRILTLVALLIVPLAAQAPSPRELFERARLLEESSRSLDEAIALYTQVSTQSTERELAATALLRVGLLSERQGRRADAQSAFRRIVAQYGDQTGIVRQAEARLSALEPRLAPSPTVRRVWGGDNVDSLGVPSPDGKYLSFADWNTGNLAVRDLATGEERAVTNKRGWTDSPEFVESSVFSPDGKQLAYAWFNGEFYELRIIRVDGTERRTLYRNPEVNYLRPEQWSVDSEYVSAILWAKDRTSRVALISVADGSARVVKSFDWRAPRKTALSPDARFIAYDFPPQDDAETRDIFVLSTDAGQEVRLISHVADEMLLGWTPDGGRILFASDRTGAMSAWAVAVRDGRAQGEPELIKAGIGDVWPMGFTRTGSYYYGAQAGSLDVYLATFDAAAGRLSSQPVKITERFDTKGPSPAYSPDGRRLVFIAKQLAGPPGTQVPGMLGIRTLATGNVRELMLDLNYVQRLYWPADGRWILATGRDRKNRDGIFRIDPTTGAVSAVVLGDAETQVRAPGLSPDGTALFYLRGTAGGPTRIVRRDVATEEESEVFAAGSPTGLRRMALSPDGRQIAVIAVDLSTGSSSLQVVSARGDNARTLVTVKAPESITTGWDVLAWSPDSGRVFFAKDAAALSGRTLWHVAAAGGDPVRIDLPTKWLGGVALHPQGGQMAITAGEFKGEIWVLEHFFPVAPRPAAAAR